MLFKWFLKMRWLRYEFEDLKKRILYDIPIVIDEERRVGNTTRIVDHIVQELFIKGEVRIWDHFCRNNFETLKNHSVVYSNRLRVFHIVLNRIFQEHPGVEVEVDKKELTIKIVK